MKGGREAPKTSYNLEMELTTAGDDGGRVEFVGKPGENKHVKHTRSNAQLHAECNPRMPCEDTLTLRSVFDMIGLNAQKHCFEEKVWSCQMVISRSKCFSSSPGDQGCLTPVARNIIYRFATWVVVSRRT